MAKKPPSSELVQKPGHERFWDAKFLIVRPASDELSSETMQTIMREAALDIPATLKSPAERAFRNRMNAEVVEMKKQGLVPDWTLEFPDG